MAAAETDPKMAAAERDSNMERFKGENHSAFIVGYTGQVGSALIKDLNEMKIFKKVVLIGRREIPLEVGPEFEQKVVNFDNLEEHKDVFNDLDVGFCTLGTTRAKAGKEGFVKIDRDYVLESARLAKAAGCRQFILCSSTGADEKSMFLYMKTKGEAEEGVKALSFDRASVYRPASLLGGKREDRRVGEKIMNTVFKPVYHLFPEATAAPIEIVARAMINNVMVPLGASPEATTHDNKSIHQASGMGYGCKKNSK